MALMAREPESKFTPAPEGVHLAVCCDVVDMGMVDGQYGPKHKCKLVWMLDEANEDGRRFTVSQRFTVSLSDKAKLRKQLEAWRGKKFSADELRGFDLEKLIGAPCQVQVVHNLSKEGKTFANVEAVMPLGKGMTAPRVDADYVREQDRPKAVEAGAPIDPDGREYF